MPGGRLREYRSLVVSTLLAAVRYVLVLRFVRGLRRRDVAVVERLSTSE